MTDTGANMSLINKVELERIEGYNQETVPTLPINNILLVGAIKYNKWLYLNITDDHRIFGNYVLIYKLLTCI